MYFIVQMAGGAKEVPSGDSIPKDAADYPQGGSMILMIFGKAFVLQ